VEKQQVELLIDKSDTEEQVEMQTRSIDERAEQTRSIEISAFHKIFESALAKDIVEIYAKANVWEQRAAGEGTVWKRCLITSSLTSTRNPIPDTEIPPMKVWWCKF
jgi:hypothetical protein